MVVVIILGLGFTGQRLAWRLLRRGERAFAAVRGIGRFREPAEAGITLCEFADWSSLPRGAALVLLIPPLPEPENAELRAKIEALEPRRIVYVSSTGVYGDQPAVDEKTPAAPGDERGRRRLEEERRVAELAPSVLILRAAAIYGPGRGVHAAIREGKIPRGVGSGVVSRIHVEDLAAIVEAGVYSDLEGAWPVADDEPCSTAEIAAWCAERLGISGLPLTGSNPSIAGRRVDGTKIRERLGVQLRYRSWKTGMPASIAEEEARRPKFN